MCSKKMISWVNASSRTPLCYDNYDWEKVYQVGKRWYKGDFHTHTVLSDGKETVENAMKKAKDMQMDFYVPTEHNVIHTGWVETDVMIVPGIEVTIKTGHFNLFGIDRFPETLQDILENMGSAEAKETQISADMNRILCEARERGWITSINHPFLHIWKWEYEDTKLSCIDCLEIVNDPTYTYAKNSNQKAIAFLDWLWQDGYRIWGIGGSDSHNLIDERYEGASEPSIAGDPGTYLYLEHLSPKELLRGLKNGHAYVSRYCGLDIRMSAVQPDGRERLYLPGDEIVCAGDKEECVGDKAECVGDKAECAGDKAECVGDKKKLAGVMRLRVRIEINGLAEEPTVYQVENRVRSILPVREKRPGVYVAEGEAFFGSGEWQWLRFDVRDAKGNFLAYTNPVYSGAKEHRFQTYGEALRAFEESENDTGNLI